MLEMASWLIAAMLQLPVVHLLLIGTSMLIMLIVLVPSKLDPEVAKHKVWVFLYSAAYVLLSRDTSFQLPPDPGKSTAPVVAKKRIVFVRHGESAWNECFNRRLDPWFLFRLLTALYREAMLLLCLDSVFIDSPLSSQGVAQARLLEAFLESEDGEELWKICENAVFACSCLRRAASTATVAFGNLLRGRPIWVLSSLQEISRNVDTLALAAPYMPPPLQAMMPQGHEADPSSPSHAIGSLQAAFHTGSKPLNSHGAHRLEAFCAWVFSSCAPTAMQPNIVVAGHSLWFRSFFQAYLPHSSYHECKHKKIVNCGVIAFDLELLQDRGCGVAEYRVVPESIVSLHGGFEGKKRSGAKVVDKDV
mmetsp:Transcript_63626/g.138501  ORF Transcript_63626/g.138501 Transcript_63626/m.138501 type:complete len:362 (+) Transcript_63626:70-1155(+)